MNRSFSLVVTALCTAVLTASSAFAETRHVPGVYSTIQDALDVALDGDEVVVADGTYAGPGNKNLIFPGKVITLRSESGNRDACIIDCENDGRFVTFVSGDTATVRSITIENGDPGGNGSGGAVLALSGSNPSFIDCEFRECTANHGGAIRVDVGSDTTIDGCRFTGNVARGAGGGVDARGGRISGSVFRDNVATFAGGGARLGDGFEEISDSLFLRNENPGVGGGGGVAVVNGASTTLRNVVFLENRANFGGTAEIAGFPDVTFVNCLFVGNLALTPADGEPASGGAVDASEGSATLVNCTFYGNTSDTYGGALIAYLDGHATLVGCVLWDNDAPIGPEIRISYPDGFEGGRVTVSYSDVEGGGDGVSIGEGGTLKWGDGNIDEDPLLDEHHCPSAGSPVIDAADNESVPEGVMNDIYGRPRFVDDPDTPDTGRGAKRLVDMGACEYQTCAADLDRDGSVGFDDVLAVLAAWGPYEPCPPGIAEDIDHDCEVGFNDLLAVLTAWGSCP